MPSNDVPDIARKFVGQTLTVVQTETWHPAARGRLAAGRRGRRDQQHPGHPQGHREHHRGGGQTVQAIDLDVKVAVPLIGKKIEPFVVDAIRSGLQKEHELGRDWTN